MTFPLKYAPEAASAPKPIATTQIVAALVTKRLRRFPFLLVSFLAATSLHANIPWPDEDHSPRRSVQLNSGWQTTLDPNSDQWQTVSIPHNWDGYEGFRQAKHGVLHGSAHYRRDFTLNPEDAGRQIFLMFEGVGSYATVWVNDTLIDHHGGGLTTFTLDITHAVDFNGPNKLTVRADHPAGIRDLPWVCGGCELSYGFSEGTQPFGIFRPVHLVITDSLRVEPFGVHIWNDENISQEAATLHLRTQIRNHGTNERTFQLINRLLSTDGQLIAQVSSSSSLAAGDRKNIPQQPLTVSNPHLWSPEDPYLYTMETVVLEDGKIIDCIINPYGIRWIEWPDPEGPPDQPLLINGNPFFINGVADYEHMMGNSHAFTDQQILTRIRKIRAAGFNAFRDAHHPHNLRFQRFFDQEGMLWWTQNGAQIWFDNEDFKNNYKLLVRDWVRERRNSPSLILYGLQNESKLPAWFTKENVAIIRELDPTASIQRLIASCNGGEGTDWNIPQNWTGTYGGDPYIYDQDLRRQRLVAEYGAWRSLEYHSEGGFDQDGPHTESRMNALMELKVRLAETVRDKVIGHFAWPFTTHQNPGRNVGNQGTQTRDGIRPLDQIGPANNKGLQTIWGELLDVFYMYRSNYAPAQSEPMLYIVSHTWPDRWTEPGHKDGIIVYSNCDEVELFSDYKGKSIGTRSRGPAGTHFTWDNVLIEANLLYAEGRIDGKVVASDLIALHHLPQGPGWSKLKADAPNITQPISGHNYLYRVNAGGPGYTDINGNTWSADRVRRNGDSWGSNSWAEAYPNLHSVFGSKRKIFDPIRGTQDDLLFQSFRYGLNELTFTFNVPAGDYTIELFFIEPWYGTGGGLDATGWRLFDVAINDETVIHNLDIYAEAGRAHAIKKTVQASAVEGKLVLSFPRILSTQAVISAIAVSTKNTDAGAPPPPPELIRNLTVYDDSNAAQYQTLTWLDTGVRQYSDRDNTIHHLPWELREASWIRTAQDSYSFTADELMRFQLRDDADVFIAHDPRITPKPSWLHSWEPTGLTMAATGSDSTHPEILRRGFNAGDTVILGPNGQTPDTETPRMYTVIVTQRLPSPPAEQIHALLVTGTNPESAWLAVGNLRAGRPQYTDGGPVITQFPNILSDADWIRTAQADAANPNLKASFRVDDHLEVFVALDQRIPAPPQWMQHWLETPHSLTSAPGDNYNFRIYRERFGPGDTVQLGPNGTIPDSSETPHMYSVMTRTIRAAQYYDPPKENTMPFDWIISVSVGDRYNLNFSYTMEQPADISANLEIISTEGDFVCSATVLFPAPDKPGERMVSRIRTCHSINAGTYHIRLTSPDLQLLTFHQLEVE